MWTFATDRDEHLDEHNQYDHADLSSLIEGKVLGVDTGIIKQVAALLLAGGTMAGDINMGGNDLIEVVSLQGTATGLLSLRPGTGQGLRFQDDTGVYRIRIDPNSVGDLIFIDTIGTYRLQWDQSRGTWRVSSDLDMEGNNFLQVGEITGDDAATLIIRPGAAQQLQLRDSAGPTRLSLVNAQPLFLHDTSGAAVLAIRDTTLDNYNRRIERVLDPTSVQDAATKKYVDDADGPAIHDNVASEISAVTLKATPISGDFLLIEDSAAANAKKRITVGSLPAGSGTDADAIHDNVAAEISAVTLKATPVSGDHILIEDSAAANVKKRVTVGSLPAGGSGGLDVTELNSDTILSASGVYVIDTTSGNITITLPILSGTPAAGYRIQVIRDGANYVYLKPNVVDDYWDTTTQRTLFDPYSAVSVAAGANSASWLELGRWRTVT